MINMDMIGRMTDAEINIFGTGTANVWDEILDTSANDTLNITTSPGGMGSSDHASFYEAGIPVLHYFTGTHEDYHRPTDTAEKINYSGMVLVLNHISDTINRLDEMEISEIEFVESTDQRSSPMRFNGVTLGVIPDYNYSGSGMRIESVRAGETADRNGFEDGDIIIKMGDDEISDIFAYMEALSDLQTGDSVNILLLRNGRELELTVEF
jgi:C-terminal processing protease CtpA/Prc